MLSAHKICVLGNSSFILHYTHTHAHTHTHTHTRMHAHRDDSVNRTVAGAIISAQVFSQRQSPLEVNNECNKFSLEFTIPTVSNLTLVDVNS